MKNTELIKFTLNFLDSTEKALGKLIDFYIDYAIYDESIKKSIARLLDGYMLVYPTFPAIVTGKLDGSNLKQVLIHSLENLQISLHFSQENPEELRLAWIEYTNYRAYYSKLMYELMENNRFVYLSLN